MIRCGNSDHQITFWMMGAEQDLELNALSAILGAGSEGMTFKYLAADGSKLEKDSFGSENSLVYMKGKLVRHNLKHSTAKLTESRESWRHHVRGCVEAKFDAFGSAKSGTFLVQFNGLGTPMTQMITTLRSAFAALNPQTKVLTLPLSRSHHSSGGSTPLR